MSFLVSSLFFIGSRVCLLISELQLVFNGVVYKSIEDWAKQKRQQVAEEDLVSAREPVLSTKPIQNTANLTVVARTAKTFTPTTKAKTAPRTGLQQGIGRASLHTKSYRDGQPADANPVQVLEWAEAPPPAAR